MSEHSKILEKYEKMFEDGSAYKPIKIQQPQPSMSDMSGANVTETPLGNPVEKNNETVVTEQNDDLIYTPEMQAKLDKIRNPELYANTNTNMQHNTQPVNEQSNVTIKKLEGRIELLEKALTLVMEQQTKLLKESK